MSEFPQEFIVESKHPEKDFNRAIKTAERHSNHRRRLLHVNSSLFQPSSVHIGDFHFVAEGTTSEPKSIFGLPLVVIRHKEPWEKQLDTTFNVADVHIPIPRVTFILDQTVQPPQIICRATL